MTTYMLATEILTDQVGADRGVIIPTVIPLLNSVKQFNDQQLIEFCCAYLEARQTTKCECVPLIRSIRLEVYQNGRLKLICQTGPGFGMEIGMTCLVPGSSSHSSRHQNKSPEREMVFIDPTEVVRELAQIAMEDQQEAEQAQADVELDEEIQKLGRLY